MKRADSPDSKGVRVRSRAAKAFEQIERSRSPASRLRSDPSLEDRDQRLLADLVLGTLRWRRRLDHVLESASERTMDRIDREIRAPLRIATYQLLYLNRTPGYAAVDAAVEEVKKRSHRGATSFANAVLRKIASRPELASWPIRAEDPIHALAISESYPDFLVERWWRRFGEEETRAALAAGNRRSDVQLLCLSPRDDVARALEAEGVTVEPGELSPLGLRVKAGMAVETRAFASGSFYIQDQASQVAAMIPWPDAPERILDTAAAPGGKSFALLAAQPASNLIASDLSLRRLLTMKGNQVRLERTFPLVVASNTAVPFGPSFDRVVLDLPCTGSGTFARHPELKWRISASEVSRLASQGLEFLAAGAQCVNDGGLLCVITCSVEREENEEIVIRFLRSHQNFRMVDLEDLPNPIDQGVLGPGFWRVLPSSTHDGFTVHVLRRE